MKRFIQGECRTQSTLLPERLDDYIAETNPVRVVDVFVDELDLGKLGFEGVEAAATGRPAYHPASLLKIYIYGYLNRIQSSRRLEKEAHRNVELMWLTDPDARSMKTRGTGIVGYNVQTAVDAKHQQCSIKGECTPSTERRIARWDHEDALETMQNRLDHAPESMRMSRQTVEHPFGTIKLWMGSAHFLTKTIKRVSTEMSLYVLAYNLKRVMKILGPEVLMAEMRG